MDEQNNGPDKELQQKQISVWIGVSIVLIVGVAIVAYALYMSTHPGATMFIPVQ